MDITFRVTQVKDELRVQRLHPELPADSMFDDYQIDSTELLYMIYALSAHEFKRQRSAQELQQAEIEEANRRSLIYPHRDRILKELPRSQGVYLIKCTETEGCYVGASKNIRARIKSHLYDMTREKSNHPLSQAVEEFGFDTIEVSVLELVSDKTLLSEREQHWINEFDSIENGFNSADSHTHPSWTGESDE